MGQARRPTTASEAIQPRKSRLRQNIESLALALLVALAIRATVVEAFWVPSGSMLPTIQIGDHLFVNKLAYGFHVDVPFTGIVIPITQWSHPRRGDIVVFVSPNDGKTDLIKRVVAVAGDKVEMRQKRLFINDEPVEEPWAHYKYPNEVHAVPRDNFGPVVVPPGKFFVMGDNRDESLDSRYWGFADEKAIKGKATFIYWSGSKFDRLGKFLH
ncbi:MAG: signal peptidase I [Candidatus Binatia bacterium]|nr:signal peptidase I [Candidatus Binatia bacterium]